MRAVSLLGVALLIFAKSASGQGYATPSAHFGALTIPNEHVGDVLGVSMDRFTPNGKVEFPGQYNGIDRTLAFNFLTYSATRASPRWDGVQYRLTAQIGWGHDQPSEWIQNGLHRLTGRSVVPSVRPRNHALDGALSIEALHWSTIGEGVRFFWGGGLSGGTPMAEAWVQSGGRLRVGHGWPEPAIALRFGSPLWGGAFGDPNLASGYVSAQMSVTLPVSEWVGWSRFPHLFVAFQQDSGFFSDEMGRGIPELLGTIGFSTPDGRWHFEAWNEYFRGPEKDRGPTGGGRLTLRLPASGLFDWVP